MLEEGMLDWFQTTAIPKIIEHRGKLSSIATLIALLGAWYGLAPDVADQLINAAEPETINSVVGISSHLDPTYSGPEIGLNPDDTYGANQYPQADEVETLHQRHLPYSKPIPGGDKSGATPGADF
jgi:hypothetical protein